jgi:hypothetical protein|tara:strand:- start:472 stop:705 length:234 start_codon:yes stop_codon:yes gene_type:complete
MNNATKEGYSTMDMNRDCQEYVDLINGTPNGWGQYMHPVYGQSHSFLRVIYNRWGKDNVDNVLMDIWEKAKGETNVS